MDDSNPKPAVIKKSFINNYLKEYWNCASIHGFKYFAEDRSFFEKIWWFLAFFISLSFCMFCIGGIYKKWDQSPVIVSFATEEEPIYNIPFPAITVCLESKVKNSFFNYSDALIRRENLNETEAKIFGYLNYVCDIQPSSDNSTTEDFFKILETVTPELSIFNCNYAKHSTDCRFVFKRIITDDGLCYTFNMADKTDLYQKNVVHYSDLHDPNFKANWSIQHGHNRIFLSYPLRALLAGIRYGWQFDFLTPTDKPEPYCRNGVGGFKVLFHSPMDIPRFNLRHLQIPFNKIVSIAITPSQIKTSEALKSYPAEKRKCYFPSERKLKYFNIYTRNNCDLECLTNYTLEKCGCVVFYMPRENGTEICNGAKYSCTFDAEYDLQTNRLLRRIYNKKIENFKLCQCLPSCVEISYKTEISHTDLDPSHKMEDILIHGCPINSSDCSKYVKKPYHASRMTVYFNKGGFIGSERNELYGPMDFLANFGGLLGLFTGFSVLSLMEIVYFLTIRLVCNRRLYGHWIPPTNN